jgi:hypothetical protein
MSHVMSELAIGGSIRCDVERLVPGPCSMACPHLDVRRRLLVGGVRSSGKAEASLVLPRRRGRGEDRTGEWLEPSLMPRDSKPRKVDVGAGCKDWPRWSGRRRLGTPSSREEHRRPWGIEGTHPGRSSCVWNAVTPSGSGREVSSGKPTARRAQLLGGNRMTEKRMPVAERRRETGTSWPAPPAGRLG